MRILIVWAFLTLFIMLSLFGAVAMINYNKLTGGTCSSVGGYYQRNADRYTCYVKDYINDEELR